MRVVGAPGDAIGPSFGLVVAASAAKNYRPLGAAAAVHGFSVAFTVAACIAAGAIIVSALVLRTPQGQPGAAPSLQHAG